MSTAISPAYSSNLSEDLVLTEFTRSGPDLGWFVLNDNVMGGRSTGGFDIDDAGLLFSGSTNTRGGGFSSIRTAPLKLDLSAYEGIRLRVKGDGRRYTWRLATDARWRGREVGYWADFDTTPGGWRDVDIPFADFLPQFRGYRLDGPPLDASKIRAMGLMIYDEQDGPFELRLEHVMAYTAADAFSLSQYRWQRRLLVLSAPDESDEDLGRQLDALAASTGESADRDLTVVILLDNGVSTAGGRRLEAKDVAAARRDVKAAPGAFALRLIGKDGSVKLSRGEATSMQEIYSLIDSMPMRMREVATR